MNFAAKNQTTHQEMRYPNVTSFYFATSLAFNAPTEEFRWDDHRKILHGDRETAKVQNGEEILPKVSTPWVGRTNATDGWWQTTDGFATAKTRTQCSDIREMKLEANKHPVSCEAQLASKCLFKPTFWAGDFDPKVCQSDLVFGVRSGSTSRSVHARLQISVCSGYDLFYPGCHPGTQTVFWPVYTKSSASWANNKVIR